LNVLLASGTSIYALSVYVLSVYALVLVVEANILSIRWNKVDVM